MRREVFSGLVLFVVAGLVLTHLVVDLGNQSTLKTLEEVAVMSNGPDEKRTNTCYTIPADPNVPNSTATDMVTEDVTYREPGQSDAAFAADHLSQVKATRAAILAEGGWTLRNCP